MFCRFFILRPAFSMVISLVIIIAGLTAIWASPVEQYPNIVPPCLSITATFPGANSEGIANSVAAPLEDQLSGIANMIYMQSSSQNGSNSVTINVYFEVGTNLQLVEADAINRINTAMPQLPTQVQAQGVTVRLKNPDLFLSIPFYSENGYPDRQYISNYVQRYIYPELEQIPGVGFIGIHGQRAFAIRAALDPNKMAYYHVSVQDIAKAINDQNNQYSIGMNAAEPMHGGKQKFNFLINPPGYFTQESQFQNVVIRANESTAQIVRLSDVADVKLDAQKYNTYFYEIVKDKNNQIHMYPSTSMMMYLYPGANELAVKKEVAKAINETAKHLPNGIKYLYHYDSSEFVLLSIQAVVTTLLIAFALVFLVVMLFIQNFRGTIIPILAIPVSIIGAFAGTYVLGFSINTMTLFGMVLAIGIVVDDAIVVLECVERIMADEGLTSTEASIKAMSEVANPIIAVVLVLNAVFLPVAFLGGFSGVLMKQFAVTIAISVFLSGIVALTLTPTLCAIFMKKMDVRHDRPQWKFFTWFNRNFDKLRDFYLKIVSWIIDHSKAAMAIWVLVCVIVVLLFVKLPTSLIPLEDMGYYYDVIHVTEGGSINYMLDETKKIALEIAKSPLVNRIGVQAGLDTIDNGTTKTNTSTLSVILSPYEQRTGSHQGVNDAIAQATAINQQNKEVTATAFNQPPIRGMSPTGGVTFYLMAKEPVTVDQIHADSVKLVKYLKEHYPAILSAQQFYNVDTPQLYVNVDAKKAYMYGVTETDVYNALQAVFGTYYVNYFSKWNDLYWVILQGKYEYRDSPDLLNTVYVKSNKGANIPVGSLSSINYKNGPEVITRFNDYMASQIVANPNVNKGYTQGQVMQAITDAVPKVLGKTYEIKWFGPSYQEALAGNQSVIAFTLGLIMVFLILVALYESWTLPAAVVVALPFALFGAAMMLFSFSKPDDIYFQISLLTLIGLSGKNAILIVEFAIEEVRHHSATFRDAALKAARLRFRPIVMTSLAFIFGAVPLATATGAGANAQHSVGTGIIGGMLGSTFIATLFIPLFFVLAMKITEKFKDKE